MSPPRIVLATNNAHKLQEIARALGPAADVVTPREVAVERGLGPPPDPEENGTTYLENAVIKARAFSAWSGLPALADDSGIEVTALGGAPGLHSARFAGVGCSEADNRRLLLERLAASESDDRSARFVCVLAWVDEPDLVAEITGSCPGRITTEEQGDGGFGYDPIFVPEGDSRTFAEMSSSEKDARSHRGRALAELRRRLAAGRER